MYPISNPQSQYCEQCNISIPGRHLSHINGTLHKNYPRLKQLLGDPQFSLTAIGIELGITKERVRQLAKIIGVDSGRQRLFSRKINKLEAKYADHPFIIIAASHGLEAVPTSMSLTNFSSAFIINGKKVVARKAARFKRLWTNGKRFVVLRNPQIDFDFAAIVIPNEDGSPSREYLIIPKDKMPVTSTTFCIDQLGHHGTYSSRHDYRDYLEAWDLLKGKTIEEIMKIKPMIPADTMDARLDKYSDLWKAVDLITKGMALPIVCDTKQEAVKLQGLCYTWSRTHNKRLRVNRQGLNLFIQLVDPLLPEESGQVKKR